MAPDADVYAGLAEDEDAKQEPASPVAGHCAGYAVLQASWSQDLACIKISLSCLT